MSKEELVRKWELYYNFSKELIKVFIEIPREEFVLKEYRNLAYEDNALPIIKNQTISSTTK